MQSIRQIQKSEYRNKILLQLQALPHDRRIYSSDLIAAQLKISLISFSGFWGVFNSLKTEPLINWQQMKSDNIIFCYPRVVGDQLQFFTQVTQWGKSHLGVLEPEDGEPIEIKKLSGVFIPGIAFHTNGYRLGRGAGFYDRALSGFKELKVGLCFDFCLTNDVPYEGHDIKMNMIITDQQLLKCAS